MKKQSIIAILIVALAVGGLYFIKNKSTDNSTQTIENTTEEAKENSQTEVKTEESEDKSQEETEKSEKETEKSEEETEKVSGENVSEKDKDFEFFNADKSLEQLKDYEMPIIYTIGSVTCQYCEKMKPELKKLNEKYKGEVIIKYASADDNPQLLNKYPVQGLPATIVVNADGTPYEPSKKFEPYVYQFASKGSDVPELTMIFGYLQTDQLEDLIGEINESNPS